MSLLLLGAAPVSLLQGGLDGRIDRRIEERVQAIADEKVESAMRKVTQVDK